MAIDSSRQPGLQLLTNEGELTPGLSSVAVWGGQGTFHRACGTSLIGKWWCGSRKPSPCKCAAAWFLEYVGFAPGEMDKAFRCLHHPGSSSLGGGLDPILLPFSIWGAPECSLPLFQKDTGAPLCTQCLQAGSYIPTVSQVEQGMRWWGESHLYSLVFRLEFILWDTMLKEEQSTENTPGKHCILLSQKGCLEKKGCQLCYLVSPVSPHPSLPLYSSIHVKEGGYQNLFGPPGLCFFLNVALPQKAVSEITDPYQHQGRFVEARWKRGHRGPWEQKKAERVSEVSTLLYFPSFSPSFILFYSTLFLACFINTSLKELRGK